MILSGRKSFPHDSSTIILYYNITCKGIDKMEIQL